MLFYVIHFGFLSGFLRKPSVSVLSMLSLLLHCFIPNLQFQSPTLWVQVLAVTFLSFLSWVSQCLWHSFVLCQMRADFSLMSYYVDNKFMPVKHFEESLAYRKYSNTFNHYCYHHHNWDFDIFVKLMWTLSSLKTLLIL